MAGQLERWPPLFEVLTTRVSSENPPTECQNLHPWRNRITSRTKKRRSLSLPGRRRSTQQEPEDDDVAHPQERHVHGQEEPGNTKMENRQVNHRSLVHGEQEISDPHEVEQPDERECPSWPEPEREDGQQG